MCVCLTCFLTFLPVFEQEDKEQTVFLLDDGDEESNESEAEDEGRQQPKRKAPAWVDEDDELEEE